MTDWTNEKEKDALAEKIWRKWFPKGSSDVYGYIRRRLDTEAGRFELAEDIQVEHGIRVKDIDRRIELSKMTESELLDEMDENDKWYLDELEWAENL